MRLHELRPAEGGAVKPKRRIGRGTATGQGKTAGRGQKGQWSRSGGGVRPGFEGGQTSLMRRLPKRGFNNFDFETKYTVIDLDVLNKDNKEDRKRRNKNIRKRQSGKETYCESKQVYRICC